MKEFNIKGKLYIEDDLNHNEMLGKLFELLKQQGLHFSGVTKEVENEIEIHNR